MNRQFLISTLFLLSFGFAMAQPTVLENKVNDGNYAGGSVASIIKAAEEAKDKGDHFTAFKYYEAALQKDSSEANFMAYGAAAEHMFGFEQAIAAYQQVIMRGMPRAQKAEFQLAGIYYQQARYEEAGALYDKIALDATSLLSGDAKKRSEDCIWAANVKNDSDFEIPVNRLGESINTEFSEFAPFPVGDSLYFSSLRFPRDDDKHKPARVLGKVLVNISAQGGNYTNITEINKTLEFTAHTAFSRDKNSMYYTICDYANVNSGDIVCQIYKRNRDAKGGWSEPERLPDVVNTPGKSTTQPSIGYDKLAGHEVLFFVSDKTGGKGQRDIYSSLILADGTYGVPQNLSDINTEKDDITPFYHQTTGDLYFSSNGLRTLGGYDIFKTKSDGMKWAMPDFLPAPINSCSNDLYYALSDNGLDAYFASNRVGSLYYDTIGCCYDLYKADLFRPEVIVQTYHRETKAQLTGTQIQILPVQDMSASQSTYDLDGFERNLEVGMARTYRVIASKNGYDTDTLTFTTDKDPWRQIRYEKLYLTPMRVNLIADSYNRFDKSALNGTTFEFTDLGLVTAAGTLASVKSEAERTQRENLTETSNRFARSLEFNHRYMVLVRKNGYTIDSVMVSTEGLTKTTTISKDLFLAKGGLAFEALSYDASTGFNLNGVSFRLVEKASGSADARTLDASNLFTSQIAFGKAYCVVAEKAGFSPDSVCFNTNNLSTIDFTKITKKLYLRPAGLFPVVVYFDNDEPNKRTNAKSTKKAYGNTYEDYVTRRSQFEQNSPDGAEAIASFFEKDVAGGWLKLQKLNSIILAELQSGKIVELEISGYASPRAQSDYNRNLTQRRTSSVENHFEKSDSGVFATYIKSGKLRFVPTPNGEENAQSGISDSIPDEKNSIYTVAASRERRAQVTNMRILPSE
jgi:hypothetical protein